MNFYIPLSLFVGIVSVLYFYIRHLYSYWDRKGFVNIPPTIPYGNVDRNEPIIDFNIDQLYKKLKGKAAICGIYLYYQPIALLTNLDIIKQVLIKDFAYFQDRGLYYNEKDDPISATVLTHGGEKWRALRQKLTPTFTSGKMKFMFPLVTDVAKVLDECLSDAIKENGGKSADLEMREILSRYTTDTIGTCAFGFECNSLRNPDAEFRRMGKRTVEVQKLSPTTAIVIAANPKLFNWLGVTTTLDDVAKFFTDIVRQTIDYRTNNNMKRNDFMNILMELKDKDNKSLTFDEIVAHVFLFFAAGFETSATTLSFVMHELMVHPDIQQRVREEIHTVLADHNDTLTYEAMMDMQYLEQVVKGKMEKWKWNLYLFENIYFINSFL